MITPVQGTQPLTPATTMIDATRLNLGDEQRLNSQELSSRASQDQSPNAQQGNLEAKSEGKSSLSSPPQPDFSLIASRLEKMLEDDTSVQFSIDEQTKKVVLKIVDNKTQEVVRQLPPEESLKIAQYITSKLEQGKVTDAKI